MVCSAPYCLLMQVGLVPQIRSFLATGKAKLAVSLHATTDEVCVGGGEEGGNDGGMAVLCCNG